MAEQPNDLVAILLGLAPERYAMHRVTAALRFSAWIRWPFDEDLIESRPILGVIRLLSDESLNMTSVEMEAFIRTNASVIANVLPPSVLLRALQSGAYYSEHDPEIGKETEIDRELDELVVDEAKYAADVIRFMITYRPRSKDLRSRASLNKAHYFMDKLGGFRDLAQSSSSTRDRIWLKLKSTAVFLYVNEHHFQSQWDLNPLAQDLSAKIGAIINDIDGIRQFFRYSLWIYEELDQVMDRRATRNLRVIEFPKELSALKPTLPEVPKNIYRRMSRYAAPSTSEMRSRK